MNRKFNIVIFAIILLFAGIFIGKSIESNKRDETLIENYYRDIYGDVVNIVSTLSYVDDWDINSQDINMNGYEKFKRSMYEFYSTYSTFSHIESKFAYKDIKTQTSIESIIHIFNTGLTVDGHQISSEAFNEDGVISNEEVLFLENLLSIFESMNGDLQEFNNVEKIDHAKLYSVIEKNLEILAEEFSQEKLMTIKQINSSNEVLIVNEDLAKGSDDGGYELMTMNINMIKEKLPNIWQSLWHDIYISDGELSDNQIARINYLLQSYFNNENEMLINPLGCFFTSYYEDVRELNFTNFLRYFPFGEVPESLTEFEELSTHVNWPFKDKTLNSLPVPIHRYKREEVETVLMTYTSIKFDELIEKHHEEIIYLESTDSFYNYTSDFGPGFFKCRSGSVEEGEIKLVGQSMGGSSVVLTIIRNGEKYIIKSFSEN